MIKRVKLPRFPLESRRVALKVIAYGVMTVLLGTSVWMLDHAFKELRANSVTSAAIDSPKEADSGMAVTHPLLNEHLDSKLHVPKILSAHDRALYIQAIEAQEEKEWPRANRLLKQIENKILVGHVLAERYLGKGYTSTYTELVQWLSTNSDHPRAAQLYQLAQAKKPGRTSDDLTLIKASSPLQGYGDNKSRAHSKAAASSNDWNNRAAARLVWSQIKQLVRQGKMQEATRVVLSPQSRPLTAVERDLCLWHIASGYFAHGDDRTAYRLASQSAQRSGHVIPGVRWVAGITAWRLGNVTGAARHFGAMADHDGLISTWDISAAAYWAYRAYDAVGNSAKANRYLHQAAESPRTFYGILARRKLGASLDLDIKPAALSDEETQNLYAIPAVRRAIALKEIGENDAAETELRTLFPGSHYTLRQQLLTLAMALDIPAVQIPMGKSLSREDGRTYDYAIYPVPGWQPEGGYQVDPALIFALARQESGFHVDARSPDGAMGIMQLMPQTASYMARRVQPTGNAIFLSIKPKLKEPVFNIMLGESYLSYLMEQKTIEDNLFYLAAAYNAGPGKVAEWQNTLNYKNDPLLFMESIPFPETRNYIGQVIASYWIYSELMGRPAPSIQAVASGRWPRYQWNTQEFAVSDTSYLQ